MCCSTCKYLNLKDGKDGRVAGRVYWCTLKKEYVRASDNACPNKEENNLSSDKIAKIETEGKEYYNDITPVALYFIIAFILLIIGLFMGVFTF